MVTPRLFVYGSLKRGERHHAELARGSARFLGTFRTAPGYRLVALGEYYAMEVTVGLDSVSGELFEVDTDLLTALDAFEGEEYCRGPVSLMPDGSQEMLEALAYLKRTR